MVWDPVQPRSTQKLPRNVIDLGLNHLHKLAGGLLLDEAVREQQRAIAEFPLY